MSQENILDPGAISLNRRTTLGSAALENLAGEMRSSTHGTNSINKKSEPREGLDKFTCSAVFTMLGGWCILLIIGA